MKSKYGHKYTEADEKTDKIWRLFTSILHWCLFVPEASSLVDDSYLALDFRHNLYINLVSRDF